MIPTDLLNVDVVSKILETTRVTHVFWGSRWIYGDSKGEIYAGCKRDRNHPESWTWGPNGNSTAFILCVRDCSNVLSMEDFPRPNCATERAHIAPEFSRVKSEVFHSKDFDCHNKFTMTICATWLHLAIVVCKRSFERLIVLKYKLNVLKTFLRVSYKN